METEKDLIVLFLNNKIDKDTVKTLLTINGISFKDFNRLVKDLVDKFKRKKKQSLNVNDLLDDKFKKEVLDSKAKEHNLLSTFVLDKRAELEGFAKGRGLLTFRAAKRLLSVEELKQRGREYLKGFGIDVEFDDGTIAIVMKSLEFYIKNVFDKVEGDLTREKVRKALKQHLNTLNL